MKFKLNVNVTEKEYVEFNKFHLLRSPYGKRYMLNNRIVINACMGFICFCVLYVAVISDSSGAYVGFAAGALTTLIYNMCLRRVLASSIEKQVKNQLKDGNNLYTAKKTIELYDDKIVDYNEQEKSETSYKKLERVCVVDGTHIYLYVTSQSAHIIPISVFESHGQYEEFLSFLESRGKKIEFYLPESNEESARPLSVPPPPTPKNDMPKEMTEDISTEPATEESEVDTAEEQNLSPETPSEVASEDISTEPAAEESEVETAEEQNLSPETPSEVAAEDISTEPAAEESEVETAEEQNLSPETPSEVAAEDISTDPATEESEVEAAEEQTSLSDNEEAPNVDETDSDGI